MVRRKNQGSFLEDEEKESNDTLRVFSLHILVFNLIFRVSFAILMQTKT